jgi:hypothetical protein
VKEVNMSLAEKILNGDLTAASRLITDIDDEMDSAIKELKELYFTRRPARPGLSASLDLQVRGKAPWWIKW